MSARDVIANTLWPLQEWDGIEANAAIAADAVLTELHVAGYSIIPPGGMHEPTLEKAADIARARGDQYLQPVQHHYDMRQGAYDAAYAIAAAIRALSHEATP